MRTSFFFFFPFKQNLFEKENKNWEINLTKKKKRKEISVKKNSSNHANFLVLEWKLYNIISYYIFFFLS